MRTPLTDLIQPGIAPRRAAAALPWSMASIDLNADLGETVAGVPTADDEAMFAVISSASIACGGHAGDAASLAQSVDRAARFGVAVGAHPSYPDRAELRPCPDVD